MNVDYYDEHAEQFFQNTYQVNMQPVYARFLAHLPSKAYILDLGCGSGRDTLAFKQLGYQVDAMDLSIELVKRARALTHVDVQQRSFYQLNALNKYDGVWACASLLHCERQRLAEVLHRIYTALKPQGVCYMSFKYGTQDRKQQGRTFTDLNEVQLNEIMQPLKRVIVLQQWISNDQRPDREEQWLNVVWQKQ